MPPAARIMLALAALVAVSCGRSPGSRTLAVSSPGPPLTVTGWITEIEDGKLSLRVTDGRSLIFTLEHPPMPVDRLRKDMDARSPIRITYRAEAPNLVPLRIDEPCPGPDCPPPYTQPPPFSPPAPTG
ncbi:MAG TPA: hypothetical protein VII47_07410 [Actinomycetota bacterium]|jgi:hypothetical protein